MVPANGRGSYSLLGFRLFLGYKLLGFRDYYHRGLCRVSFSAIAGHALTSYLKPLCNFPHCSCPSLYKAPSSQHISWIRSKTYRSLSSPPWLHSLGAPILPYLFTKFPRTCWLLGWGLSCTYHLGPITLHPAPQIPPPHLLYSFLPLSSGPSSPLALPHQSSNKYPASIFPHQTTVPLRLSRLNLTTCSLYSVFHSLKVSFRF